MTSSSVDSDMTSGGEPLKDILKSAMEDIEEDYKEAYEILLQQAENGFLEENQAKSSLTNLADRLLRTLDTSESEDEN